MSEENKALMRRFFDEVMNAHNPEAAATFCTPDIVDHNPFPNQPPGLEGTKLALRQLVTAFPDLHCSIDTVVSEGDLVVAHYRVTGTQNGNFMGSPASGKKFDVAAFDMVRVVGGKAKERWGMFEEMTMAMQLGMVPDMP
jgi:predicted ester cyclase